MLKKMKNSHFIAKSIYSNLFLVSTDGPKLLNEILEKFHAFDATHEVKECITKIFWPF